MRPNSDWYQTRWWRVIRADGSIYCETSDPQEAIREYHALGDKDARIESLWAKEAREWRDHPLIYPATHTLGGIPVEEINVCR